MSYMHEKVAYLKGLAEGMKIASDSKEGKLLHQIIEVLADFSDELDEVYDELDDLTEAVAEIDDYMEALDEDLTDLEEDMYDFDVDDMLDYGVSYDYPEPAMDYITDGALADGEDAPQEALEGDDMRAESDSHLTD